MASLNGTFDATTVPPAEAFTVIPAGKYKVQVVDSDLRATKDGQGQYLWLEMEILDGEHQGRKVYDRLNIVNQNAQAVDIAQRALSALCHAAGKLQVSNSEELHFIPVIATVKVRQARENFDASNEVRGYEAVAGGARPSVAPTQQRSAPPPAAAPSTAPWKNRKTA